MNPIVVKFGGSSLATAGQFEKVAAIIRENPGRRYVVASAPGKRFSGDTKVTDLLYRCYDAACAGQDFAPVLDEIRQRFADISPSCSCRSISRRTLPPSKHTCALHRSATIWPAAANI